MSMKLSAIKRALRRSAVTAAVAAAMVPAAGTTPVQAKGPAKQPNAGRNTVATIILATEVARYAREQSDSMAMMVAGSMLRNIGLKQAGTGTGADSGKPDSNFMPDPATLFEEAKVLAGERPDFLAIISEAAQAGTRSVVESVGTISGRLGPKQATTFNFTFSGDSDAAAGVTMPLDMAGGGASDLDLYVTDSQGASVCSSEGPGMPEICRWTPRRTGKFQVKVVNRQGASSDFLLFVK